MVAGLKNIEIEKATLPFYKSSKDISTEHLGLGLNISKILSERHGGNIQIANNKAGGACVTVKNKIAMISPAETGWNAWLVFVS